MRVVDKRLVWQNRRGTADGRGVLTALSQPQLRQVVQLPTRTELTKQDYGRRGAAAEVHLLLLCAINSGGRILFTVDMKSLQVSFGN